MDGYRVIQAADHREGVVRRASVHDDDGLHQPAYRLKTAGYDEPLVFHD